MSDVVSDNSAKWAAFLDAISTAMDCFRQWAASRRLTPREAENVLKEMQIRRDAAEHASRSDSPFVRPAGWLPLQASETPGVRGYRAGHYIHKLLAEFRSEGRLSLPTLHAVEADARQRMAFVQSTLVREGLDVLQLNSQVSAIAKGATSVPGPSVSAALFQAPEAALPQPAPPWPAKAVPAASDATTATTRSSASVAAARPRQADQRCPAEPPQEPPRPGRKLLEILLDPRSIQCLLGLGGALMLVGLVILLWINNYFTPPVMAVVLGVSNLMLLSAGLVIVQKTRYQMVGKALALLSCLVMPLNLWYCHTQQLMTIDGHLWVYAVGISAAYGLSAWILRDELFVYVLNAGVTLTGLLILADLPPSPQRFLEIASPATLLVVLGLINMHLIRAFVDGDGPFSRQRFGMAFFWSGHVQLACGLLLVLAAQVAGDWLYAVWFRPLFAAWNATPSPICGELRWLALVLVLCGLYAFVYSDLAVRKRGIFLQIAAVTLLWAEVLIVQLLNLRLGVDAVIGILAATSLLSHLGQALIPPDHQFARYARSLPFFGLLLGLLPIGMGIVVYLDHLGMRAVWSDEPPRWTFVGAMLLSAVACRVGAHVSRASSPKIMTGYFLATAAATMIAAVAAMAAAGMNRWESHAPIMMLLPLAWLVAARFYGTSAQSRSLAQVAHVGTIVMLASSFGTAISVAGDSAAAASAHLTLALFFAEVAVFYGLATWFRRQPWCVYASSLMAGAACWQLMAWFQMGTEAYILAFAVAGLIMLIIYRLALLDKSVAAPLSEALFQAANAILSLAFVSSVLYGLSRYYRDSTGGSVAGAAVDWGFAGFCIAMLLINMLATAITRHPAGHRWYVVTSSAQAVVTLLAVHRLIDLSPWQQVELFCVLLGLAMLVFGHIGWYREQNRQSDAVSTSLFLGSLLASIPLAIATWVDRAHNVFYPANEFGYLFVSVGLLVTGILFQLKSTTITGTVMTGLYFLTLLLFVRWDRLNSVALAIIIGGGTVFGLGMVLAFFRDRLLTLPDRIQKREGVFRVFNWR